MTNIPGTAVSDPPTRKRVDPELRGAELLTIYEAHDDRGGGIESAGYFESIHDAQEAAHDGVQEYRAWRMGDTVYIFGKQIPAAAIQQHDPDAARERALAKLTDYDKRVLGLAK